jgi:hypothetical protein
MRSLVPQIQSLELRGVVVQDRTSHFAQDFTPFLGCGVPNVCVSPTPTLSLINISTAKPVRLLAGVSQRRSVERRPWCHSIRSSIPEGAQFSSPSLFLIETKILSIGGAVYLLAPHDYSNHGVGKLSSPNITLRSRGWTARFIVIFDYTSGILNNSLHTLK